MKISFRKKILPGVYLGFSKSLFKFKKSRSNKQEDLEVAKTKFLKSNYEEFNDLLVDYFAAKGVFVTPQHTRASKGEVWNYMN